jgi:hypothetical protein
MALTADNVVVGITGKVYAGPTTAPAPTSSDSTLNAAFVDLGYVSTEGVEFSTDRSTSQIRAWQNADLVREVVTESTVTYSFMLLESNQDVIETYFGASMVAGKIELNPSSTGGRKSFVIDIVDGDKNIRHYVPAGEIMSIESQTIANGEALMYGVTITAYQTNGRSVDIYYGEFEAGSPEES